MLINKMDEKFIEKEFGNGKGAAKNQNLITDLIIRFDDMEKSINKLSDLIKGKRRKYARHLKKEDKLFIYNRDKNICQKCKEYFENTAFLQVDHIDKNKDNNNFDNLQTLCRKCHHEKTGEENSK